MAEIETSRGTTAERPRGLVGRFMGYIGADRPATRPRRNGHLDAHLDGHVGRDAADRGRRLALRLDEVLAEHGVVLHRRRAPLTRGVIDHVVVAPTGVWLVEAGYHQGKVEQRDVGGWFRSDERLFVGGRDRTDAVRNLRWQVDAVLAALGDLAGGDVPIRPTLCLVGAEWPWFPRPFTFDGVRVLWPQELYDRIAAHGPLSAARVDAVARRLGETLPAKQS